MARTGYPRRSDHRRTLRDAAMDGNTKPLGAGVSLRAVGLAALSASVLLIVGCLLVLASYTHMVFARGDSRATELETKYDALAENQRLIVAQLEAGRYATGTVPVVGHPIAAHQDTSAASGVPFSVTPTETNMGVNVVVGRFARVRGTSQAGWSVTLHTGNYLDGAVAFNVASSHGDVFKGSYYVDENTDTVSARLLRGASVETYGWDGHSGGAAASPVTTDAFTTILARDDAVGRRWRSAWFWMKLGPHKEILTAVETPPQ